MKKLLLLTALAALSACSQKAEESKETTATPAETTAPATAADSGTRVGTYDVKMADGAMTTTVINADGTFVDTDAKGVATKGTFAVKDGKDCFDPEGDEAEFCSTPTAPAADGSFTATDPKGAVVTITPRKK